MPGRAMQDLLEEMKPKPSSGCEAGLLETQGTFKEAG